MRKLVYGMNVSLVCYVAAPGEDLGWSVPGDELFQWWSGRVGVTELPLSESDIAQLIRDYGVTYVVNQPNFWDDLAAIFGTTDYPGQCQCQRFKVLGWIWRDSTQEERTAMLRSQTACGDPDATTTSGLVAYVDDAHLPRLLSADD